MIRDGKMDWERLILLLEKYRERAESWNSVARRAGISGAEMCKIKTRKNRPNAATIWKLGRIAPPEERLRYCRELAEASGIGTLWKIWEASLDGQDNT